MPRSHIPMRAVSVARVTAFEVLQAVFAGAYASDALRERSTGLSVRDAGLTAQIVFGCLRYQSQLNYLIFRYSGRDAPALGEAIQIILRSAIFQLRYLERVPPHAAVHESVELAKRYKRAASGFVNAVLRKVNREPVGWPDLATELSCPSWLLEKWSSHFSVDAARAIATAALQEPHAYIRIRPGSPSTPGIEVEPTEVQGAFRLLSAPRPGLRLHDISSQAIVPLLELEAGDTYLDLCAAPGNKTMQALETPLALAVACDISPKRIREMPAICPRLLLDATEPLPFGRKFDRIFIDAPCSGTGTLARNPEIKWRLTKPDLDRFQNRQVAILKQALKLLSRDGKLVYATCSLEEEENEQVVARAMHETPEVRCTYQMWRVPGRDEGDGFFAAVLQK